MSIFQGSPEWFMHSCYQKLKKPKMLQNLNYNIMPGHPLRDVLEGIDMFRITMNDEAQLKKILEEVLDAELDINQVREYKRSLEKFVDPALFRQILPKLYADETLGNAAVVKFRTFFRDSFSFGVINRNGNLPQYLHDVGDKLKDTVMRYGGTKDEAALTTKKVFRAYLPIARKVVK